MTPPVALCLSRLLAPALLHDSVAPGQVGLLLCSVPGVPWSWSSFVHLGIYFANRD